mgnify:FL=1
MATIDLGKIKFNWRGTYAGGTAYVPDDVVYYMDGSVGSSYMCVANTTGNAPSSGGTPHASWEYLAKGQATSPTTTQGDVIVRGASADERLAIGSANQVLKVNGSGNGLTYGTGGGIAQVIQSSTIATGSLNLTTRGTLYDIPHLNVTITPASTSSKFLINGQVFGETDGGGSHAHSICIKRAISGGATTIIAGDRTTSRDGVFTQQCLTYNYGDDSSTPEIGFIANYLDAPSASAAVTYTLQMADIEANSGVFYYNRSVGHSNSYSYEMGISYLTVMEVVV